MRERERERERDRERERETGDRERQREREREMYSKTQGRVLSDIENVCHKVNKYRPSN